INELPYLRDEIFIQRLGHFWRCRLDPGRTQAAPHISVKSELRNDQHAAINVFYRPIHLSGFVIKDAQGNDLRSKVIGIDFRIVAGNAQQNDETLFYLAGNFIRDSNFRARHALDHSSHYLLGGLLGLISTRLGRLRSSCWRRSRTTLAMSAGCNCQEFWSPGVSPPNSVFTD